MKTLIVLLFMLTALVSCLTPTPPPTPPIPTDGQEITISWNMFTTDNVIGYKLYYSNDSNMTNRIYHENCDEPIKLVPTSEEPLVDYSMTCNDFPIEKGDTLYVVISAVTHSAERHSKPMPFRVN